MDCTSCRIAGVLILGAVLAGCYALSPLKGAEPQVGKKVAFDVNDTGRVALGGTMGPQIAQVEGQLLEKDSTGYLLAVSQIRTIQGGQQVWSGEQVRVNSRFVGSAYERKFSLGRTIGLGAVGAGGVALFVAGFSWATGGADPIQPPSDTGNTKRGRP
jgi:hypothetical protein